MCLLPGHASQTFYLTATWGKGLASIMHPSRFLLQNLEEHTFYVRGGGGGGCTTFACEFWVLDLAAAFDPELYIL